jgi:AraC family transcriptional regulator of arabinose operon
MRIQVGGFRYEAGPQTQSDASDWEANEWTLVVTLGVGQIALQPDSELGKFSRTIALLVPPIRAEQHDSVIKDGGEGLFVRFQPKPDWLPWLRWPRIAEGVMAVEIADDQEWGVLQSCVQTLQMGVERRDPYGEALAMNTLERIFLLAHGGQSRTRPHIDKRVSKVIRFVKREIGKDTTIEAAASVAGLSPSRLSHLFRDQMGVTFTSYLQLERLRRARIMLEEPERTTENIARELGMDPAYFSSWFRRWSGISPKSYRSLLVS